MNTNPASSDLQNLGLKEPGKSSEASALTLHDLNNAIIGLGAFIDCIRFYFSDSPKLNPELLEKAQENQRLICGFIQNFIHKERTNCSGRVWMSSE